MTGTPIHIGTRRELFVDDFLIDRLERAALKLHTPVAREPAMEHDAPWEGNTCAYHTVFRDGALYRMYYRGSHCEEATREITHPEVTCYAESRDGIHWEKPHLGLVAFKGSKKNNIISVETGGHCFAPFKDENPDCTPEGRYKALDRKGSEGLCAFQSADGLRWKHITGEPVITEGAFDSQNLAFWDGLRGRYVEYHRHFRERDGKGVRDIMTGTSSDFLHWTTPVWLDYGEAPEEHLYTNQVIAYPRAPHIFLGFPKRFMPERTVGDFDRPGVSDGVFMSSRDGVHFKRWSEAFIRPGLQQERWVTRNNMTAWGLVETRPFLPGTPNEWSLYSSEHYYRGAASRLRRFSLRLDGFVSVNAPLLGGEAVTKPLIFTGEALSINYSTSAAGSVRVELQDAGGRGIEGFALEDCETIYGDEIDGVVRWKGKSDVSRLAGGPVRLRFVVRDADVFAFRFNEKREGTCR